MTEEMIEDLKNLLPELELIGDPELREKVVRVWVRAMDMRGWTPEDLSRIPFTLLIDDVKISYLDHVRGVTMIAATAVTGFQAIYGDRMQLNSDWVVAGALLHDIGKLLEYEEKDGKFVKTHMGKYVRHPFTGVGLAMEAEVPPEVIHIIAIHSKENAGGKRSPEAAVVHHADFMNFEPIHDPLI